MKEKQIDDMAKALCGDYNQNCYKDCFRSPDCYVEEDCRTLYNAGYRKQSEGEDTNVPTKWISVEERLPEKGGYYLICQKSSGWCDEVIQTARWNNAEQKFRGAQAGCFMEHVTHWMPLPDAPKGE